MSNIIKAEAYKLFGLDSLKYEKKHYGREYDHYLHLSYVVSEFARQLLSRGEVSLHCHEYSIFYAGARLKRLGVRVKCIATYHGTKVGRAYGARVLERIAARDGAWPSAIEEGLAELEGLARHFDTVTFVGDSTRSEGRLFYGVDGTTVRNGINIERDFIDWDKKEACRRRIQEFLTERISKVYGLELNSKNLIPMYTVSRTELENKGYLDLLDAMVIYDRVLFNHIKGGELDEDTRAICLLITAQAPKEKLPDTFPVSLDGVVLESGENKLNAMIQLHELGIDKMADERRVAAALLYPQWVGRNDGAFGMNLDEIAAGCIAGIFPSRYDPFLLTGLEAAKEGTPVVVSRVCGFSDAVYEYIKRKGFAGGVEIVDNINLPYIEAVADYSTALYTITEVYLKDMNKYKMMCSEAFRLAEGMGWEEPVREYLRLLGDA
jgi:glycosyltransferase involved in cell wall biosynthesis